MISYGLASWVFRCIHSFVNCFLRGSCRAASDWLIIPLYQFVGYELVALDAKPNKNSKLKKKNEEDAQLAFLLLKDDLQICKDAHDT